MNPFSYAKRLLAETFGAEPEAPTQAQSPDPYAALTTRAAPVPPFNPMDPMGTMNHFGFGESQQPTLQVPQEPQAPQSPAKGFLQRMQDTPGMGLGLMQLGAGIAAGRDWGEGLGAGFSGMADTLQKQKVFDYQQKQQELEMAARQDAANATAQYRRDALLLKAQGAQGKASDKAYKPYTITMADGSVIQGSALATQQGGLEYMDTQGRPVDPNAVKSAVPYAAPKEHRPARPSMIYGFGNGVWTDKTGRMQTGSARSNKVTGDVEVQTPEGWKPFTADMGTNFQMANNSVDDPLKRNHVGGIPGAVAVSSSGVPMYPPGAMNESEAKASSFAQRAVIAQKDIDAIVSTPAEFEDLVSVYGALKSYAANNANAEVTPTLIAGFLKESGGSDSDITKKMASPAFQFLQGVLRTDTGAAYGAQELANYWSAFLPVTGDTRDEWRAKRNSRDNAIYAMASRSGIAAPYILGLMDGTIPLPKVGRAYGDFSGEAKTPPAAPNGTPANTNNTGVKFLGFE